MRCNDCNGKFHWRLDGYKRVTLDYKLLQVPTYFALTLLIRLLTEQNNVSELKAMVCVGLYSVE